MGKGSGSTRVKSPSNVGGNISKSGAFSEYADGDKINKWVSKSIDDYPYQRMLDRSLSPTFNVAGMSVDISRTDKDSNGNFRATIDVGDIYGRDVPTMSFDGEYSSEKKLITEIKDTLKEHIRNSKVVRDNLEEDYYNYFGDDYTNKKR